jgi:hypothetical protein
VAAVAGQYEKGNLSHEPSCSEQRYRLPRANVYIGLRPEIAARMASEFIERCTGGTWAEVGAKLARMASWEFEDHRES